MGVGVGGCAIGTLGASWLGTLGSPGIGEWEGWRFGGARRCHNSKNVPQVGNGFDLGDAHWRWRSGEGPMTTCKPWMILASVEGAGTAR